MLLQPVLPAGGSAVALVAAGGLVRQGHLYHACFERWLQVCTAEVLAMRQAQSVEQLLA